MSRFSLRVGAWPTTIKVPLMVAALMVAVSVVLSNQVLSRVSEAQQRHLQELTLSQTAAAIGRSEAAVAGLLRRGLKVLRETLTDEASRR